ncbi:unnamed protein product [Cuscuta europaea]|uniref:Uncharacterized protein n=1 Tax=Cuscuta europaea TaxID=41803 RepID=A0A9P0ZYP7_CUSEU|nr:unnamed protein product [Cuscuta europaea]
MAPTYLPLRWESTGEQWWFASPIDCAAANGHYDLVKNLLQMDPNLLIKLASLQRIRRLETLWDDDEHFHGVANCRSRVAETLLRESETREGQNSLIRAGYGGWILYTAASAGDFEFVKELLEREPLLVFGEGEYGVTDMFYAAAKSKNSEVLRLLLDYCSRDQFTLSLKKEMLNMAVHAAARGGNVEMLREILGNFSDVLACRDDQGSTLLHSAAGRGQVEVVKTLLMSTEDISSSQDKQGNTALHVAAYRGYLAVVEILVVPSSASLTNNYGDTFLHMAVAGFTVPGFRRLDCQIELMKQLVSGKLVDIESIINVRNNDGQTALHMAVMDKNTQTDLVDLLMTTHLIDLNICDNEGNTPLDLLKQQPKSASTEILIKSFVSAGAVSKFGNDISRSKAKVYNVRPLCIHGGSPGTSFKIVDSHSSGLESSDVLSPCRSAAGSGERKLPYLNSAARRLKVLLQRVWRKEGIDKSMEQNKDCSEPLIPLRQRFSTTPTPRGILGTPLSSFGSPSSPLSGSYLPSPMSTSLGNASLKVFLHNAEKSKMKRKHGSFNMRSVNKYFCFATQRLAVENTGDSSRPHQDEVYMHAVSA